MGGGPPCFRRDFSCPALLWILPANSGFRLLDFHLLWYAFPKHFCYPLLIHYAVHNPESISSLGLGSSNFARHYFWNRFFSFFSCGYLDVSVPRVFLTYAMYSRMHNKAFNFARFPHSVIYGSQNICFSP